jgi:hypothetical protein
MQVLQRLVQATLGIGGVFLFLWEFPIFRKFLAWATTFDFFYERIRDPSWVGRIVNAMIYPPPGTAIIVALVGLVLIYWSTKPRETRMSPPIIGMLICLIGFAGFGIWYLVRQQSAAPKQVTDLPKPENADQNPANSPLATAWARSVKLDENQKRLAALKDGVESSYERSKKNLLTKDKLPRVDQQKMAMYAKEGWSRILGEIQKIGELCYPGEIGDLSSTPSLTSNPFVNVPGVDEFPNDESKFEYRKLYLQQQNAIGSISVLQTKIDNELSTIRQRLASDTTITESSVSVPAQVLPKAPKPSTPLLSRRTVRELRAFYEGRTRIQADAFMADEKGKLIEVEGTVVNVDTGMAFLQVGRDIHNGMVDQVECRFGPEWNAKLGTYRQNEHMKIRGVIGPTQNGAQIYLENCEVVG